MKLQLDEDGHAVLRGGHPVYLNESGKEVAFNAAAALKRAQDLEAELTSEKIGGHFDRSKFVAEKIKLPADMMRARFTPSFKLEDGKAVGYDANGQKIWSRINPGNVAEFDEALERMVAAHPHAESIMKPAASQDHGARGNYGGGDQGGAKALTRNAFDNLNPFQKMAYVKAGGTLADDA